MAVRDPYIRNEMYRSFAEAVKRALREGGAPEDYMMPVAKKLVSMALDGELDSPVTLGAIKEVVDRVQGKVTQQISVERTDTTVDSALLGSMSELLKLAHKPREKVVAGEVVRDEK